MVETTVLSRAVPPDVWYELHPAMQEPIDSGALSNLQLESIVYACQQHERTKVNPTPEGDYEVGGFFLGDAAGVGKGRTIAGLILENWLRGRRKHMWFSVSGDLYHDSQRDLMDVGKGIIPTLSLTELRYDDPRLRDFEVRGEHRQEGEIDGLRVTSWPPIICIPSIQGILFVTYATCVGKAKDGTTRIDQIINWVGEDFNGCLVFDEGHKGRSSHILPSSSLSISLSLSLAAPSEQKPTLQITASASLSQLEKRRHRSEKRKRASS